MEYLAKALGLLRLGQLGKLRLLANEVEGLEVELARMVLCQGLEIRTLFGVDAAPGALDDGLGLAEVNQVVGAGLCEFLLHSFEGRHLLLHCMVMEQLSDWLLGCCDEQRH